MPLYVYAIIKWYLLCSDARYDDLCSSSPVAMHEMLKAWQYEPHICPAETIQVSYTILFLLFKRDVVFIKIDIKSITNSFIQSFVLSCIYLFIHSIHLCFLMGCCSRNCVKVSSLRCRRGLSVFVLGVVGISMNFEWNREDV